MRKILINKPSGEQEIIVVGEGGGYFDQSAIVWNELTDGAMPAVTAGGLVRVGDTLNQDAARQAQHDSAITVRADAKNNETIKKELEIIDRQSIRSIREWIAVQPSAPQALKDHEASAAIERGKLK